jgi:hypothetical protein
MHLLIPHASALGDAAEAALKLLARNGLPNLAALLGRLQAPVAAGPDAALDEYSLNPPQERALLRAAGWPEAADGQRPWAAWLAAQDGVGFPAGTAIGLLTPVHWSVGADQISLLDPALLALDEAESRAHLAVLQDLVAEAGWQLHYGAPTRWYVTSAGDAPLMAQITTASLERVIGRNIDLWLPRDKNARLVRRLQVELQMTLHGHPLTEAREARGALPVNSFWLSGTGLVPAAVAPPADLQVDTRLAAPLLAGDWQAWCDGWQALDAGPVAAALQRVRAGGPVRLTLCGERHATSWAPRPLGWLEKLGLRTPHADAVAALRAL